MQRRIASLAALGLALAFVPIPHSPADEGEKVPDKPTPVAVVVDLTLKGQISEDPSPVGLDGTPISDNLRSLAETLAKAKTDDKVKGLVLRLRNLGIGQAKGNELRRAIVDFRASGKKAFAVLELAGNADYLVATAADEIVLPESGFLMLKGTAAHITFYKGLFDKLGLQADAIQVGEFKGAGEPYTRTEMSPPFRAEIESLVGDSYAMLAEAIAKRQGIALDEAKKLIDDGPYIPSAAKAAGLVNRVAYPDQVEAEIAKGLGVASVKLEPKYGKKSLDPSEFQGLGGFLKMMSALSGDDRAKKAGSGKPKVAVLYAAGMIQTGRSSAGGLFGNDAVLGSDTLIKHLREAEADPTVKAIVLRVDSPGGSALASDLMWREITRIEKPIVASMSDVAASGGYYISMGCDRIVAEPGTLTGSIGVISIKLPLGGLMDRIGVTTETVAAGKNGDFDSPLRPWTDAEKASLRKVSEEVYHQFVAKAAQGRKMEFAALEKLAGGRVYTGRQAQAAGLVDDLGTLDDAIASAKNLAGLDRDADTELLILPKAKGLLESFFDPLEGRDTRAGVNININVLDANPWLAALPAPARDALARVARLAKIAAEEPVLLMAPFDVQIR